MKLTRKLTTVTGRVFFVTAYNLQAALAALYLSPDGKKFGRGDITERVVKSEIDDGRREITMEEGRWK